MLNRICTKIGCKMVRFEEKHHSNFKENSTHHGESESCVLAA